MAAIRTRFAPSPTGYLHLGGARTALFNYLFARRNGGAFVVRIEDTDRARSSDEYVRAILDGLSWLGLEADEGPFFQSKRGDLYRERVAELLAGGHAYYCFCEAEAVEAMRKKAQAEGRRPVYDRTCREVGRRPKEGETAVVRFKSRLTGETAFQDLVRGPVLFDNRELDDFVLVRSDGSPTFHLVVVLDDIAMGITHILRGEDHLTNTPRQLGIFHALGAQPPAYGHLPLIVGSDRARLSKRHGATALDAYREQGFLPDAVVNYLARLGWSHGDQEIFTREELAASFDIAGIGKAAAAFDIEKFTWVNAQHMKMLTDEALAAAVAPWLEVPPKVAALLKGRARTLVELAEQAKVFVTDEIAYDAKAAAKFLGAEQIGWLRSLAGRLERLEAWNAAEVEQVFRGLVEELAIKLGALAQPARVALTGGTASPGIFEVCEVLGRERTVARLRTACVGAEAGTLSP